MSWIPKYVVSGGMYGGANVPSGSLTGFINDFCTNKTAYASDKSALGNKSTASGGTKWAGAYGASDSLMREYALNHADGQYREVDLFEIVVENPAGAQFYKQSIVISGQIRCTAATEYTRTVEGVEHHCTAHSIAYQITKIRSRNYATPYSDPTSQNIVTGINRGSGGWTYVIGDEEALPVSFNSIYDGVRIALGNFTFNNVEYFGCAIYGEGHNRRSTGDEDVTDGGIGGVQIDKLKQVFGLFEPEETEDPNDDPHEPGGGHSKEDGGDGDHNRPVDPVPIPDLPIYGAATAGFITMYRLAPAEMWLFGQECFTQTIWDAIRLFFSNPLDFIVGILLLPFKPDGNAVWYPKFGNHTFSLGLVKISNQYKTIDCGSIYLEPYGNNVFDFSPYTVIEIWLPYIGYKMLDVNEIMGKNIHVVYHCDCLTGDCVAFISTQIKGQGVSPFKEVVIAQFYGNCGVRVPAASVSFDGAIASSIQLMGAAIGVVGQLLAQDSKGNGDSEIKTLTGATASVVAANRPTVERSGAAGSSSGYMSIQTPYIIRKIPNQSLPDNYRTIFGYPSNIGGTLKDGFEGIAVVEDIQLNNIPAMETERDEIMDWLRKGVLL